MNKHQMELELAASTASNSARRQQQMKRAQWWFEQMRRVVDSALEWQPGAEQQIHQQYFSLTVQSS